MGSTGVAELVSSVNFCSNAHVVRSHDTRAALYTVYKIDKPVWLGTTAEYDALKEAKHFPWAAEE